MSQFSDDPAFPQLTPEEFAQLQSSFVDLNSTGTPPGDIESPQSQAWYESLVVRLADAIQEAVSGVADAATDGGHDVPRGEATELPAHVLTLAEWIDQKHPRGGVTDDEREMERRTHYSAVSQAIQEGLLVAPEVIQSHPVMWRQMQEQRTVETQRQRDAEWEVVGDDDIESVIDLDVPSAPLDVPDLADELPKGRSAELPEIPQGHTRFWHGGSEYEGGRRWFSPSRAYGEGYAEKSGGQLYYVDVPNDHPALMKSYDDDGLQTPAPFTAFEAPEELASQMRPVAPTRDPLDDDLLAAMFGPGGNPFAAPSEPEEIPVSATVTPTVTPTVGVSRGESGSAFELTPDEVHERQKRRARFARDEEASNPTDDPDNWVSHKRGSWTRRSDTMQTDTPITHPENWEHVSGRWQRRVEVPPARPGSLLWQMEQEESAATATHQTDAIELPLPEDVIDLDLPDSTEELPASSSPHEEPHSRRTHRAAQPELSADEMAEVFDVPPSSDVMPPSEPPDTPATVPASPSFDDADGDAAIAEMRAEFQATRERLARLRRRAREPVESPLGSGRGVIGNVIASVLGLPPLPPNEPPLSGGGGGSGGGGRVPPTGGGPPDEPPDGPDNDDEADWLASMLSGHAGMSPETVARWSQRLRGSGGRFLQGSVIGSATHGGSAGMWGGLASMGLGVEAGVPLGGLAADAVGAIANAPQWLQRADQSDVGRAIVGTGASVGGAALGLGVGAAIGGPVGAAVGGVLGEGFEKLVMWTEKLVEGLHSFAERINKSNEELGKYNGTIAATQMQLEMNRLTREFERANQTSASAATLADAVDEMEESTKVFSEDLSNVSNTLATMAADLVGSLGKFYEFVRSLSPVSLETGVTAGVVAALAAIPGIGPGLAAMVASQATLRKIEENTRPGQDATPMGKAIIRELMTQPKQKVPDPINPLWEK